MHDPSIPNHTLTKKQRNDVYTIIQASGFSPSEFRWETLTVVGARMFVGSKLVHVLSSFYFQFGPALSSESSPGIDAHITTDVASSQATLFSHCFTPWLSRLREELETPDLWNEFQPEPLAASLVGMGSNDNTPFTDVERERVREALAVIEHKLVSMHAWNVQNAAVIDYQFKNMNAAVNRLGRTDWLQYFYGGLISVLVNLTVDKAQGTFILALAATVLQPIFKALRLID